MRLILPHTKDGFMATNRYIDTRGRCAAPVTFTEAVVKGLAEGGGLFVPETLPKLSLESILSLAEIPYAKRAAFIYRSFGIDLPDPKIDELMDATYGDRFDDEAICPITSLDGNTHVLELWHGPTSAFKDMALQCLPHFFSASASQLREQGKLENTFLILVATSGDTGKAALEGFRDKEGIQIAVMYPDGGVSDIQYKQMATQAGSNVMVWAVKGNFDDCQTGAKNVFGDEAFAEKLMASNQVALSSANSINWGRLLPQVVYYVSSYAELVAQGKLEAGKPLDVCVPTGNFGNILAAWYAKQIGTPLGTLFCASNENRVLTDFINTGSYDISDREFVLTPSPWISWFRRTLSVSSSSSQVATPKPLRRGWKSLRQTNLSRSTPKPYPSFRRILSRIQSIAKHALTPSKRYSISTTILSTPTPLLPTRLQNDCMAKTLCLLPLPRTGQSSVKMYTAHCMA